MSSQILGSFSAACPDVVLDVTEDDESLLLDTWRGGYDLAIRIGEVIERDMIAVRLGPDLRQLAVASPASHRSATARREHSARS